MSITIKNFVQMHNAKKGFFVQMKKVEKSPPFLYARNFGLIFSFET